MEPFRVMLRPTDAVASKMEGQRRKWGLSRSQYANAAVAFFAAYQDAGQEAAKDAAELHELVADLERRMSAAERRLGLGRR